MKIKLLSVLLSTCLIGTLHAQVPGGGFESWYSVLGIYEDPEGFVSDNAEGIPGSISCEKSTDAHSGDFAVKLITKENASGDVQDGGIVSGTLDIGTFTLTIGFPYTSRPNSFKGYYKHNPATAGDTAVITAQFTRGSLLGGDFELVGTAIFSSTTTVSEWTSFDADVLWLLTGDPDSALVAGQASYGKLGSVFFLDDLAFDDGGTGVTFLSNDKNIMVYPNPADDMINIATGKNLNDTYYVISTLDGSLIASNKILSSNESISITDLADGIYMVQVYSADAKLLSTDKVMVTH